MSTFAYPEPANAAGVSFPTAASFRAQSATNIHTPSLALIRPWQRGAQASNRCLGRDGMFNC